MGNVEIPVRYLDHNGRISESNAKLLIEDIERVNLTKIRELEENTVQLGINFSVTLSGKEARIRELEAEIERLKYELNINKYI